MTDFTVKATTTRGFSQAFVHEGVGGKPMLLVHGWPETKRIWWRNIEPLADRRLRGDRPRPAGLRRLRRRTRRLPRHRSHAKDLYALVHDELGHRRSWPWVVIWAVR